MKAKPVVVLPLISQTKGVIHTSAMEPSSIGRMHLQEASPRYAVHLGQPTSATAILNSLEDHVPSLLDAVFAANDFDSLALCLLPGHANLTSRLSPNGIDL